MCWSVQSLVTLEQGGNISLISLEAQLETLLEAVVTFNPPGDFTSPTFLPMIPNLTFIGSSFCLHRDWTGAKAHGVLRPVQRRFSLIEWSWGLLRRGTCCPRYYLAGTEGEGLSNSASPHSLLPLPCFCAAYDTHHGGVHHSVLQPRYLNLSGAIYSNETSKYFPIEQKLLPVILD